MKRVSIVLVISVVSLFSVSAQSEFESILTQFHADSLKKTVEDLVGFSNRLCCATVGNNRKVAQYLVQRLKDYGVESAEIDSFPVKMKHFFLGEIDQYMYNVKGRLNGSVRPDSIVVIGAHLDAIAYIIHSTSPLVIEPLNTTPGANDNATGVAIMIEVARIFHANHLVPKYSIDFMAYDAEEIGLCGSVYDANKRKNANEKIYAMLNNDMSGLQSEEDSEWKVIFHSDVLIAKDIQDKAARICQNYTLLTPFIPNNLDSSYRNSDSWAYRAAGFRTFYTHSYEDDTNYHTTLDLPQWLNYNYMAEISKLHFSLIYDFAIENIIGDVGVVETQLIASLPRIYPNPTTGTLYVTGYALPINSIEIYDIYGRNVFTSPNPSQGGEQAANGAGINLHTVSSPPSEGLGEVVIDISHWANGMYFLKIDGKMMKVIKK
jgi:hypothetical protein